jgi:hypothetical protein
MPRMLDPFQFLLVAVAGWMNQRQQQVIEYLREENRVLREQLGDRRLRFNDDQRRRYHEERNHQGNGNQLLFPRAVLSNATPHGNVRCQQRLGGLLKYYHREAA